MTWFQDARFGMFVHWGLYALVGRGEWHMFADRVPAERYHALAEHFYAGDWDAGRLADLALESGQRYITITARHHDGFSMYDTALSDHRITKTPFGRDPIAELADACRDRGLGLGVYLSLVDWSHPGYRQWRDNAAWASYLEYLFGQVQELTTKYGPLVQLWFDGDWPEGPWSREHGDWFAGRSDFHYPELYKLVHGRQPDAVVVNNRQSTLVPGEDVQCFEQDVDPALLGEAPGETCLTMDASWGYVPHDPVRRTAGQLAARLATAAGYGSNLLLNVSPTQSGNVPERQAARLRAIGRWLAVHGEAIYRTREGYGSGPGWTATRRDDVHYLLVTDVSAHELAIPLPVSMRGRSPLVEPVGDGIAAATLRKEELLVTVERRPDGLPAVLKLT